ncbi:hypothetical protein F0726_01647 [Acidithiobacillus caldus]|nr:hypothetical protein F0726_01647 [Acidithiobacillus caldus]
MKAFWQPGFCFQSLFPGDHPLFDWDCFPSSHGLPSLVVILVKIGPFCQCDLITWVKKP